MPRFDPTQVVSRKLLIPGKKSSPLAREKTGNGITPGASVIILTGRHRGKRVVFQKPLSRGVLLVIGPLAATELLRVERNTICHCHLHQSCTGAVKISKLLTDDSHFKKMQKPGHRESEIFHTVKEKKEITEEGKVDRKSADSRILPKIKALPQLQGCCALCFLSQMEFILTNWWSKFLTKNLIK
ncbi:unnamed protein product [Gulo gulo]|uniref:60S ribosomal protein L6 n=1 Tax=Gulo gulo TaxID=48420 RepID=A0A9X9Q8D2_GULGU|nr:unnamed protein product [Gulo gulo]